MVHGSGWLDQTGGLLSTSQLLTSTVVRPGGVHTTNGSRMVSTRFMLIVDHSMR